MKPVASFKPSESDTITVSEKSDLEVALIFHLNGRNSERFKKLLLEQYQNTLAFNKIRIEHTLKPLYKRPIKFSDKITGDVIDKIYKMLDDTQMDVPEIVESFNSFFGKEVSFFKPGGQLVSPESICAALRAIKNNSPVEEVNQILYK